MMPIEHDADLTGPFLPIEADTAPTSPWRALGWLLFLLLLVCSPAVVWAVWTWSL